MTRLLHIEGYRLATRIFPWKGADLEAIHNLHLILKIML
jgi:hypothetical protein